MVKKILLVLNADLYNKVAQLAEAEDRSVNNMLNVIIKRYFEK